MKKFIKRPEHALKLFIRFAIAKGVVTYGLDLMLAVFTIVQGVMSTMMRASGIGSANKTTLPSSMVEAMELNHRFNCQGLTDVIYSSR